MDKGIRTFVIREHVHHNSKVYTDGVRTRAKFVEYYPRVPVVGDEIPVDKFFPSEDEKESYVGMVMRVYRVIVSPVEKAPSLVFIKGPLMSWGDYEGVVCDDNE